MMGTSRNARSVAASARWDTIYCWTAIAERQSVFEGMGVVKVKNSSKPVCSHCAYIRRHALLFATPHTGKCPSLLYCLLSCAAHYVIKRLIVSQGSCDFIRRRRIHPNANHRGGH